MSKIAAFAAIALTFGAVSYANAQTQGVSKNEIVIVEAVRFRSDSGIADELEPCTWVLNVNPVSSDCRLSPPEDELVPTEAGDPNVPVGVREKSGS